MAVTLTQHKIAYFPVPKCACTSLKQMFFQLENGFAFRQFRMDGRKYMIHTLSKTPPFARVDHAALDGHVRFAVVRDPVKRVVSCYANKIVAQRAMNKVALTQAQRDAGLDELPDLSNFIRHLDAYQRVSNVVRHHTMPLSHFLGPDPDYYHRLFRMEELADLVAFVAEHTGQDPVLPHAQSSKSTDYGAQLTAEDRSRIETMFAEDLEIYGDRM